MKNIVLMCAGGMSTSLLVERIKKEAIKEDYEMTIGAYGVIETDRVPDDTDLILLAPQVRFSLPTLEKRFPNFPIEIIDMKHYGQMNGVEVLKQIKNAMK
ncbi:PTS sugar transporter subunit IIB [Erysipelothrix urinaevulpis]|uniref:PTS sugar transporter subunit IIB n=1 Tax=Erysipelothrix urinaevulpis TaxID=2683717 RepID=UPI0013581C24|nr:PTS sugar transporter subunit IIB [Erysipelothrix urinaevulpis]